MISITGTDTGDVLATATVEVDEKGARITSVYAEVGNSAVVPPQLGAIDFSLLVRTASMLSAGTDAGSPPDTSTNLSPDNQQEQAPTVVLEPTAVDQGDARQQAVAPAHVVRDGHARKSDMPSDFGVTYWRLGSVAKVAKHYDVPHHIAHDWIKQLQQDGRLANPWPKKRVRSFRG
ncbi:hypothetical protein IU450_36700 [Nocardia abscessus]|uniref:hypothetical protein n=1 Tax=Nocardia abscessus TaxID=120957 RepID=UPI001894A198|nr:hypothetical protein [Nocardia abscessus]MBF6341380.1 hypothetical protein [Nocardia abscessus]